LKTYKNFLQEAAKTHEDALAMGVDELADRIRELETASDSAG